MTQTKPRWLGPWSGDRHALIELVAAVERCLDPERKDALRGLQNARAPHQSEFAAWGTSLEVWAQNGDHYKGDVDFEAVLAALDGRPAVRMVLSAPVKPRPDGLRVRVEGDVRAGIRAEITAHNRTRLDDSIGMLRQEVARRSGSPGGWTWHSYDITLLGLPWLITMITGVTAFWPWMYHDGLESQAVKLRIVAILFTSFVLGLLAAVGADKSIPRFELLPDGIPSGFARANAWLKNQVATSVIFGLFVNVVTGGHFPGMG